MRKQIWRLHSWLGLLGALPLLVIGLTGSILVFSDEINARLKPERVSVIPRAERVPLDEVVAETRAAYPGIEFFAWDSQAREGGADGLRGTLANGEGVSIYFDPHTGALRPASVGKAALTDWLLKLHVSFFAGTWGTAIVGIFAAVLLASGLSGVYLHRTFWRHFFTLRWRRGARLLLSDTHKLVGISSVGFNLILGFSGALWNLPALRELFAAQPASPSVKSAALPPMPLETMKAKACAALTTFVPRGMYFPADGGGYIFRGSVHTRNPFASPWGNEVEFDAATGAITRILDLRRAGLWTQFEDMLTPMHFGTFGGLPIKVLWCAGGLTPGALGISGFLIWRSRGRANRTQTGSSATPAAPPEHAKL